MSGLAAAELARVAVPLGAVGLVAIGASDALAELLGRVSGTGEWQTWRRRLRPPVARERTGQSVPDLQATARVG